jgi:hypothetical protein
MIADLLQAPWTAGGEISDLLQRTPERRPHSACLACVSGGGDLRQRQWGGRGATETRAGRFGDGFAGCRRACASARISRGRLRPRAAVRIWV